MSAQINETEQQPPFSLHYEQHALRSQLPDEIAGWPSTRRLVAREEDDGTIHIVPQRESLSGQEFLRPNDGLEDALLVYACQKGVTNNPMKSQALTPLPEPGPYITKTPRLPSTHVLEFLRDHGKGLIQLGDGVDRAAIIEELVQGYPEQTFAIMTATEEQAEQLHRKLLNAEISALLLSSRHPRSTRGRIAVGTFSSFDYDEEFAERDLIIAYDAQESLSERMQLQLLGNNPRGQLFGFLDAHAKLSPLEQDRLRAIFGFDEVAVPEYGCQPVSVDAVFFRYDGPSLDQGGSTVSLKRGGIWKNGPRNMMLTRLARAFADGDRATVSEMVPEIEEENISGSPRRTVLLVDSVEHAAALARRLRMWPIRLHPDCNMVGLPALEQRLLARGTARLITGDALIATPDGLSEIRAGTFDVVIWAGSGRCIPPIPWHHLVCLASEPRHLLVVDVRDRHHPELRIWSRKRRDCYVDAGWRNLGRDPSLARIIRFIEAHPEDDSQ